MKIYTGTCLQTLRNYAPGAPVFEDFFPEIMGENYAECWTFFVTLGYDEVICKTVDAIRACPEHFIYRIGRSIRTSDGGNVIETKTNIETHLMLAGVKRIQI